METDLERQQIWQASIRCHCMPGLDRTYTWIAEPEEWPEEVPRLASTERMIAGCREDGTWNWFVGTRALRIRGPEGLLVVEPHALGRTEWGLFKAAAAGGPRWGTCTFRDLLTQEPRSFRYETGYPSMIAMYALRAVECFA